MFLCVCVCVCVCVCAFVVEELVSVSLYVVLCRGGERGVGVEGGLEMPGAVLVSFPFDPSDTDNTVQPLHWNPGRSVCLSVCLWLRDIICLTND